MISSPRVFVGSSTDAEEVDFQVRAILEKIGATVVGWRDVFKPGDVTLLELLKLGTSVDAALLIASPDDMTQRHEDKHLSPRDNVLLELGIFLSCFGMHRTGILHVKIGDNMATLPTDLKGITTITYDTNNPNENTKKLAQWIECVKKELDAEYPGINMVLNKIQSYFNSIHPSWLKQVERYILHKFVLDLKLAAHGHIILSPGRYFEELFDELENVSADYEISAIATLSSSFWSHDQEQQLYVDKNIEASKKGVSIRRMFIIPDQKWRAFFPVIHKQIEAGIEIRRAKPSILLENPSLEDMVLFLNRKTNDLRAYTAEQVIGNPNIIRRGKIILDSEERYDLLRAFERAWSVASVITEKDIKVSPFVEIAFSKQVQNLKTYYLNSNVITCIEAATAKGIPLKNELKSILLSSSKGYIVVHLPGDAEVSLHKVKKDLDLREASLASLSQLNKIGLKPGTICAIKDPVRSFQNLISKRVFELDYVSTNNGTLRGYYNFPPSLLLETESVKMGDYEIDR